MEYENDIITSQSETEVQTKVKTNPTLQQEYSRFSDYSTSKSQKDYEEYEIIQTYTPKKSKKTEFNDFVNQQNSYSPDKETFVYEKLSPKPKLHKSKKIFICICCAIALCMGVLGIVNVSNINNLNYSNLSKSQEIANLGQEITKIDQVIEGMMSDQAVSDKAKDNGMETITATTEIELLEKQKVEKYQGKTNFFDRICNFFSSLFGG